MAVLTHYFKQDLAPRDRAATVDTEETNYTIPWATLTGAGFANGDVVAAIVFCGHQGSSVNNYTNFQVKKGSTFAGAAVLDASLQSVESAIGGSADCGHSYHYFGELTLATNDNIYFSNYTNSGTNTCDDFSILLFKISDLTSTNYKFASATHSGTAPATPTNGASVTLGAGDWLIFGLAVFNDNSTTANFFMDIEVGGSVVVQTIEQGEDTANTVNLGAFCYRPGLSDGTVARVRYSASASHECFRTKIMAIRLDVFRTHWGVSSANTITHSSTDVYSEVAGNGAFVPDVTGPHMVMCHAEHTYTNAGGKIYGRLQIDGSDWPAAGNGRCNAMVNGPATARQSPRLVGYGTLTASTSYDVDFDAAEDNTGTPSCTKQDAVIFSLELASSTRQMRASWAELEIPSVPRRLQASWAELQVPDGARRSFTSFAEFEIPTAPRRAQASWAEFELPNAPRSARVSWSEIDIPSPPRRGQVAFAEIEVPDGARRLHVSWSEAEVPNAPRRLQLAWTEAELPNAPRRGQASFAEFEVPDGARRGRISWAEAELPDAPRKLQLSWTEFEVPEQPAAPKRLLVSWAEVDFPFPPRSGQLSFAEFEVPDGARRVKVSWAEQEVPNAPRRAQAAWAELELPNAPRRGNVSFGELETPNAARRGQASFAELEVPEGARRLRVAWSEIELPAGARRLQLSYAEFEAPDVGEPEAVARLIRRDALWATTYVGS